MQRDQDALKVMSQINAAKEEAENEKNARKQKNLDHFNSMRNDQFVSRASSLAKAGAAIMSS